MKSDYTAMLTHLRSVINDVICELIDAPYTLSEDEEDTLYQLQELLVNLPKPKE